MIDFVFRKIDAIDVWFWHFPARENSTTAPLAIFLGGGQPATPSAERVFGPTGPCTWNRGLRIATKEEYADYGPTTNWLSYNRKVNLLYIDIPASVGFTHGRHKENTVSMAKKDTWAFLQRFLDTFPEYKNREVALWDFDFGAHYATHLAALIHERNEHIREGTTEGNMVNLTSLGLVSPLLDLPIQHRASLRFARENKHRPVLNRNMTSDLIREYDDDHAFWWSRCAADRTRDCRSEMRSYKAQFYKLTVDEAPVVQLPKLEMGPTRKGSGPTWDGPLSILKPVEMIPRPPPLRLSYDPWDVRLPRPGDRWRGLSEMPPERSVKTTWFLNKEEVQSWLGVDVGVKKYEPFDQAIWDKIKEKQEVMRSSVQTLRQVVQNGVRVLIVGGDAGAFRPQAQH